MKQIALITDTHGCLDEVLLKHLEGSDEVWHCGDWGSGVAEKLEQMFFVRGVYGNIDGQFVRSKYPEQIFFVCEGLSVLMIHIGGYPVRYESGVKEIIQQNKPQLFITGHSHILKVMRDKTLNNLLHINPGAAGKSGFHKVRTMVKFKIDSGKMLDVNVVELGKK